MYGTVSFGNNRIDDDVSQNKTQKKHEKGLFSLFTTKIIVFFVCSLSTTYDICIYVFVRLFKKVYNDVKMMMDKISSLSQRVK